MVHPAEARAPGQFPSDQPDPLFRAVLSAIPGLLCRHAVIVQAVLVMAALAPIGVRADEPFRYREGQSENGRLEYVNGLPVLTLQGTPEEMGRQAAVLTASTTKALIAYPKDLLALFGKQGHWARLEQVGQTMAPQFPPPHLRELEAFARAARVERNLLLAVNILVDAYRGAFGCSSLIVQPERSATKAPLFGRNLDFYSLGRLQDYSLVTVYRSPGKHAFASVGFPGMLGCLSGMNDAGLSLAVHEVFLTRDGAPMFNPQGMPYLFAFRRILEECTTVAEAEKLLKSVPRTTLFNLAVCDRQRGAVLETTPKSVVLRESNDGICVCLNHFCTKELRTVALSKRFNLLTQAASMPVIELADVGRKLHEVSQGRMTLQTMIFEPVPLRLHLAIGRAPTTNLPLKQLDLAPRFAPPAK